MARSFDVAQDGAAPRATAGIDEPLILTILRERVARALASFEPRARVGVAVSGGADSMALADATIAAIGADRVVLLHVDHQLLGAAAAAAELAIVRALAQDRGAALHVLTVEVDRAPASLEASARRARYAALDAAAEALGVAVVLTAHTARDQAETVLMRIVRGTGPAGLAGIRPRRGRYLRPWLATTRAEVEAYVAARGLAIAHDASNDDPRFFRNRVRARLLPALAAENPQLEAALCRLADQAREWRAALIADARALHAQARRPGGLDAPTLAAAAPAVASLVLARAAARAGLAPDATHVRALLALVRAPAAGTRTLDLPGGTVVREYDLLRLAAPAPAPATEVVVDGDAGAYEIRLVQPGDRLRPVRLGGRSKKISDLFTDARVPRRLRASARVVVRRADALVVWAEHLGVAFGIDVRVSLRPARKMGPATSLGG